MNRKVVCFNTLVALLLGVGTVYSVADKKPRTTLLPERRPEIMPASPNVDVDILKDGFSTPVYYDGSYRWIEGRRGERFAFRIANRNAFPVGVIPSADGQSLTADGRASPAHPAYVIGPYQSLTISVWRQDLRGGRELMFTSVDRSLAALKGDRRNIGVLGVLVWQLADRYPPYPVPMERDRAGRAAPDADNAKAAPPSGSGAPSAAKPSGQPSIDSRSWPERDDSGIGVGAGERMDAPAYLTDRYRRVRMLGLVALYYDDREGLRRAGVNLEPYPSAPPYPDRRRSDPFPDDRYPGVRIPD